MSEKLRETVSRLRQAAEALASKNEEGVVVWRRSMKVSEL